MSPAQLIANRFEIRDLEHDLLGQGGMGAVYRATDTHSGELVAVKALDPHVVARDPDLLERFVREGEALRQLNHPNIVRMVAAVEEQGHHYLVMEYVAGGSLRQVLEKQRRLSATRAVEVSLDLADALTRAHRLGILHRDLKPENVLLAQDGTPRLADFGLAHLPAGSRLTQSGILMGTVDYVSPEACQGEVADERSDIWSFGVMLFEMLAGCVPFTGDALIGKLNAILTQPVPDLEQLAPGAPDGLADLVYRMLEKDRCRRIPSVRQVAAELEAILRGWKTPTPARLAATTPAPSSVQYPSFLDEEESGERPIFVTRERELARLDGFLNMALSGKGRVVFITGEAGQGKTTLVQEFTRRAQTAHPDLVVAGGNCNAYADVGDPYLLFREVLDLLTGDVEDRWGVGAIRGEEARRLWRTLPLTVQALVEAAPDLIDLFVPSTPLLKRAKVYTRRPDTVWLAQLKELVARKSAISSSPNLQQSALFEQYSQVLRALARQVPLLLALDDLQWVDGGSASLLFHLGRRIGGNRILIVGAYRPAEIALGRAATPPLLAPAAGRAGEGIEGERERHPLGPIVNEFKRTFGDIEVDLHQAEGRQFVDAFLDSEPNQLGDAFRETLHQHTAGYPLFTVELLRGMQERGDLVQDQEGRWVEGPELDWQMLPARVEAVIAERIGRLPERLQRVLTVASVEGETFTAEVIARADAADEAETVRCLSDTLDRKHRLVSAQRVLRLDGQCLSRYRFQHILFQKHLYNSLDPVQRVYMHQAIGTALETLVGGSPEQTEAVALQLARHFQEAGSAHKAVEYLHQAGERAQRLYANAEAVETFRRALALLESVPPDKSRTGWRQQMAARIQESLGDVLEWTGEHDQARTAYQEALAHLPAGELTWQAHLYRKMGNIWRLQRRYERALQAYDLAQAALGQGSAESAAEWWQEWVQIQLERMWMHYWLGQWREMSELARIRSAVEQYGTPAQGVNFYLSLASMNNRRDRYRVSEETLELCQRALAMSQEAENVGDIAWAGFTLGFSQLWHGDLDDAEQQIQAALALAEQTGDIVHQSRCLTYLTVLYRKRGQPDRVRQFTYRSLKAATAGQMIEYTGMARANLAWLAWHEGGLAQAEVEGRAALELWQQLPAGHSSCAFQWTALWPLVAVALAGDRISEASTFVRALLEPTQQCLADDLAGVVQSAVKAWEGDESEAARTYLTQALELAQELGYL